jgi:hypothetical protein
MIPLRILSRGLAALLLVQASTGAQSVGGSFSPNPARPGDTISFSATDSTGLGFAFACEWYIVHQGAPDGPKIQLFDGCSAQISSVGAHEALVAVWDQTDRLGNPVPAGKYWFEVRTLHPVTFELRTDFFCLSIQDSAAPALRQTGPVRVNASTALVIEAPTEPFAWYRAAASLTSNHSFDAFGLSFCLTPDPLFRASLSSPGAIFTNAVGTLDGQGRSFGFTVDVPNDPSLAYLGLHVQALLGTATGRKLTNDISITILP